VPTMLPPFSSSDSTRSQVFTVEPHTHPAAIALL
jgi:hypothetical protein